MRPRREFTVASDAVQGPGTFVTFRRLTWGEIKPFIGQESGALDKVAAQIVDWNWTDEDGAPLPKPKDGAGVANLLAEEVTFLINAAVQYELSDGDAKN